MPLGVRRRKSLRLRKGGAALPSPAASRYIEGHCLGATPPSRFAFMERGSNPAKRQALDLSRRAIVVGMTASAAIATAAAAADASPRAFVAAIYDAYVGKNGNGVALD